jgi:hypothetical protein
MMGKKRTKKNKGSNKNHQTQKSKQHELYENSGKGGKHIALPVVVLEYHSLLNIP